MAQNTPDIKKKDSWNTAYKNFLHISYFAGFIFLVSLIFYLMKVEYAGEFMSIWWVIIILVMTLVWYYMAQMFKKRDKKAIRFGYIFLSAMLAWNLFGGINIYENRISIDEINTVAAILVFGYLLYLVYKASKSEINLPTESSGI